MKRNQKLPIKILSSAAVLSIGVLTYSHTHADAAEAQGAKPTISAPDQEVEYGSKWNPYENVTANDKEDGDLSNEVYYEAPYFETTNPGKYSVKYGVWDSDDNNTETNRNVTVLRQGQPKHQLIHQILTTLQQNQRKYSMDTINTSKRKTIR